MKNHCNGRSVIVNQGDYLSRLLHQGEIGWSVMLLGMLAAFAFGAVHALSPGHGKTLVAAYLVGSRGTPRHAIFLGLMVTFTHTMSVFALGLVTLYLSRFVLPETITPILGAISGVTIVWVGATLLYQRTLGRHAAPPAVALAHHHGDGQVHTHVPDEVTIGGLIALGGKRRAGTLPLRAGAALDIGIAGPRRARAGPADGLQRGPGGSADGDRPGGAVRQALAAGWRGVGTRQGATLPAGGERGVHRLRRDGDDLGFAATARVTGGAWRAISQSSAMAASTSSTEVASPPPK